MSTHAERPSLGDAELTVSAMARLLEAVRELAGAQDLDAIADVVRHAARELVDADGATFVLREDEQCFYVDEDAIAPLWRGQRFPLDACVSGWSMLHQEQVVIPDVYADDRVPHQAYRPTFVHSLVMTPVRGPDAPGAIGTYWADQHHATATELDLLQALADSTAVALENAQHLRRLEDRVAQRTAQIEASNRDLAAFAQIAAHDLKEPLTTIRGHAELAAQLGGPSLHGQAAQSLAAVQRMSTRMAGLVDGVLAYSTATTTALSDDLLDFDDMLADVRQDLADLIARRGARISSSDLPTTRGSRPLMERVLQNVIANAIEYGAVDGPEVLVGAHEDAETVTVTVTDNGNGIDPSEREAIFDMFTRGRAADRVSGSGIGLAFARRVVARHGGTLTARNAQGGGACFEITLPRRSLGTA